MACAVAVGSGMFNLILRLGPFTYAIGRAPSIVWQLVWNYILGPCLLWKMRMIHDIYQWRLQTTLAIVAG